MSEMEEKLIDVPHKDTAQFKPGQEVTLVMEARIGWIAVLLAYILPFVLLILTLIAVYALTNDQGLAGLSALGILVPYYVLLYGYRHRLHLNSGFRII